MERPGGAALALDAVRSMSLSTAFEILAEETVNDEVRKKAKVSRVAEAELGDATSQAEAGAGQATSEKKSDTSKDGKARRVRRPKAQKDESKSLSALTLSFGPRKRHVVVGAAHS